MGRPPNGLFPRMLEGISLRIPWEVLFQEISQFRWVKGHRLFQRGKRSPVRDEHRLPLLSGRYLHPSNQPGTRCHLGAERQHRGKQLTRFSHIVGG
jgi:hypothetical protein